MGDGAEHRDHVDDGRIDHLPLAGIARLEDGGNDAERQAEGADGVARHGRRWALRVAAAAAHPEQAGQCDVVQVMPSGLGQRAVLAPAGHAAVDQARVLRQALLGAEAQALHHARAVALDQRVGLG
ncbi:hypothetical protein D3C76_713170 [compost metagenome]